MDNDQTNHDKELLESIEEGSAEIESLSRIQDFLLGTAKEVPFTDDQKILVDGELTLYVLGQSTKEECLENIKNHLTIENNPVSQEKIIEKVSVFVDTLAQTTLKLDREEEPANTPPQTSEEIKAVAVAPAEIEAPNPTAALASIQERLQRATIASPTKSNTLDPYRELPEK